MDRAFLPTTPTFSGAPAFVLTAKLVRIRVRQVLPMQVAALDRLTISLERDIFLLLVRFLGSMSEDMKVKQF